MLSLKSSYTRLLRSSKPIGITHYHNVVDSKKQPRKFLTHSDVDLICNPNKEYMDAFMKAYGTQRLNFKENDIYMWRDAFGANYETMFVCLKGTKRVIQTSHYINFEPVFPDIGCRHQYHGFLWIDPDFRGKDTMSLNAYCMRIQQRNFTDVVTGQCFPGAMNMFSKVHGTPIDQSCYTTYVSYYKPSEMRVPGELTFDGITVKSAKEVPDEDITKYDQGIYPYERSKYMLDNLRDPDGIGKVAYDDKGNVVGFGTVVIYPSGECMLNPLYADDPKIAQAIFKSILEEIPLDDKKLLRFHIKSLEKYEYAYNWFQPFLKVPLRREVLAYGVYKGQPAIADYKRVFSSIAVTTSSV